MGRQQVDTSHMSVEELMRRQRKLDQARKRSQAYRQRQRDAAAGSQASATVVGTGDGQSAGPIVAVADMTVDYVSTDGRAARPAPVPPGMAALDLPTAAVNGLIDSQVPNRLFGYQQQYTLTNQPVVVAPSSPKGKFKAAWSVTSQPALGSGVIMGAGLTKDGIAVFGGYTDPHIINQTVTAVSAPPTPPVVAQVRDALIDGLPAVVTAESGVSEELARQAAAAALVEKLSTMSPGQQAVYLYEEEIDRRVAGQRKFTGGHVSDFEFWPNWRAGKVGRNHSTSPSDGQDMFLKELYILQGYNCLPTLVTRDQMELLIRHKAGHVLYRGVKAEHSVTAKQFLSEFQSGDYYAGRGVNGPGTYTGDTDDARSYSRGDGSMVRMMLSRKAKVVDSDTLATERSRVRRELVGKLQLKMAERMAEEHEPGRQRFVKRLYTDRMQAVNDITSIDGYYAVWQGYDALSGCDYSRTTRVVYNRAMLYVQKELLSQGDY